MNELPIYSNNSSSDEHPAQAFPFVDDEELSACRKALHRLCVYADRLLQVTLPRDSHSDTACLLLNNRGCVIQTFCLSAPDPSVFNRSSHNSRASHTEAGAYPGTAPGSVWDLSAIGFNAITAGLAQNSAMKTTGKENQASCLQAFSICFAPITVLHDTPPHDSWIAGGIAFLLPKEMDADAYLMAAKVIAHDLMLNLHLYQMPFLIYKNIGQATFAIQFRSDGTAFITHYDDLLFDLFQIPRSDYYLQPATDLIDPLPKNKQFWDIVENMEDTNNIRLSLSIQKERRSCILSSWRIEQPGLHIKGMDFVITTEKQASAEIASKIGNQALLSFDDIVGSSSVYQKMLKKARRFASTNSNVMLIGESGAGKDVIAQAIHNNSARKDKPFIAVNCAAIPKDLLTSELFGYESGAFTGAKKHGNIGKFELADGGTLFLDEIGELPLDLQASLLRIVEQKQFMRLGGNKSIHVDVKIISATNADISSMIEAKTFRADLFYRLSTMSLKIPPLRERGEDIVLLAEYFSETISKRIGRERSMRISPEASALLKKLVWPGNVRELQNLIERIVQLYPDDVIESRHIYDNLDKPFFGVRAGTQSDYTNISPAMSPAFRVDFFQKKYPVLSKERIANALMVCGGSRTKAAQYLGVSRNTLYRYIDKYQD